MKIERITLTCFSAVLLGAFILSGCMGSTAGNGRVKSSIEFGFRVDAGQNVYDFDSTLVSGNDSLTIQKIRFVFGGDSVAINDTTLAVIKDKSLWQSFSVPNNLNRNPIRLFFGNQPATYSRFIFSAVQAPDNAVSVENDFYSGGHHYSLIVTGTYNGDDFTYKSDEEFTKTFNFSPIQLTPYDAHYVFLVEADVQDWFSRNPGGNDGFYDPSDANTSGHLDSLFSRRIWNSLQGEVYSNQSEEEK